MYAKRKRTILFELFRTWIPIFQISGEIPKHLRRRTRRRTNPTDRVKKSKQTGENGLGVESWVDSVPFRSPSSPTAGRRERDDRRGTRRGSWTRHSRRGWRWCARHPGGLRVKKKDYKRDALKLRKYKSINCIVLVIPGSEALFSAR